VAEHGRGQHQQQGMRTVSSLQHAGHRSSRCAAKHLYVLRYMAARQGYLTC
jgi:hypothetical protein